MLSLVFTRYPQLNGAPGRVRTDDPALKRRVLKLPAELQVRNEVPIDLDAIVCFCQRTWG